MQQEDSTRKFQPFDMIQNIVTITEQPSQLKNSILLSDITILPEMYKLCDNCLLIPENEEENSFLRMLKKYDSSYNVFNPEQNFILLWYFLSQIRNLLVLFAILYNLFEIPIIIFMTENAHIDEFQSIFGIIINYFFLIILAVDLFIIRVNVAYYKSGILICSRVEIVKKYMKFAFWLDLISFIVLAIYIITPDSNFIYLKIVFYIKIYTVVQLDQAILNKLQMKRITCTIYRLLKIVIFTLFIINIVCSAYFAIDYHYYQLKGQYYQQKRLWLNGSPTVKQKDMIVQFKWYVWYAYAMYWSLQTSATVGYGNIAPLNPPQVLYCNIIMMLMTVMFAYFANSIESVINSFQQDSAQYQSRWKILRIFLKDAQMQPSVARKVSNYLHDVWKDQDSNDIEGIIHKSLSKDLKNELMLHKHSQFMQSVQILGSLKQTSFAAWQNFMHKIAQSITQQRFAEDEFIYTYNQSSSSLYFICRGYVLLTSTSQDTNLMKFTKSTFGNVQFFMNEPRSHNAKSMSFSRICILYKQDFIRHIKSSSSLYQKYCEIIQNFKISGSVNLIGDLFCWLCQNDDHLNHQCPLMKQIRNHNENQQVIQLQDMTQSEHHRYFWKRKNQRSLKTFKMQDKIAVDIDKIYNYSIYRTEYNFDSNEQN